MNEDGSIILVNGKVFQHDGPAYILYLTCYTVYSIILRYKEKKKAYSRGSETGVLNFRRLF